MNAAQFGPYRILEPLGQGGMGVVHRAIHVDHGQVVALKTLTQAKPGLLSSIRHEIRMLARIHHPG
ncbi:MAG: serine/threonine protein kinase, partial [Myxococcota bacterium]